MYSVVVHTQVSNLIAQSTKSDAALHFWELNPENIEQNCKCWSINAKSMDDIVQIVEHVAISKLRFAFPIEMASFSLFDVESTLESTRWLISQNISCVPVVPFYPSIIFALDQCPLLAIEISFIEMGWRDENLSVLKRLRDGLRTALWITSQGLTAEQMALLESDGFVIVSQKVS